MDKLVRKPCLVVVQSYYDREPTFTKCQAPNHETAAEQKETALTVKKQEVSIPKQKLPPKTEGRVGSRLVTKSIAPPPPPMPPDVIESHPSASGFDERGPPDCPTPDYDSSSISSGTSFSNNIPTGHMLPVHAKAIPNGSVTQQHVSRPVQNAKLSSKESPSSQKVAAKKKAIAEGDRVEMISIESFTLNNPSTPKPKPPATYFGAMVGPEKPKTVAVTIGEYRSSVERRQPARFDFLDGNSVDGKQTVAAGKQGGHMFQSELVQTLSRSNLKNQTDDQENKSRCSVPDLSAKGVVTISVNSQANAKQVIDTTVNNAKSSSRTLTNGKSSHVKPSIKLAGDKIASVVANNRVMIEIPNNADPCSVNGKTNEGSAQLNGILKNVHNGTVTSLNSNKHKSVIQQKSISFGEITMVISDVPK